MSDPYMILQPKLCNRFFIRFLDVALVNELPENPPLTKQVISIDEVQTMPHPGAITQLTFEDDVANGVSKSLQSLRKQKFAIEVRYMDCNDVVIRTHYLKNSNIVGIEYSALDYASSSAAKIVATINYDSVIVT